MNRRLPGTVLTVLVSVILLLLFAAPLLAHGQITGLDGSVAFMDHPGLWRSLDPISGLIYAIGDMGCHQIRSRSLTVGGSQMPVCVRDLSILSGFAAGSVAMRFVPEDAVRDGRTWVLAAALVSVLIADWGLQMATPFDSQASRAASGLLGGVGSAVAFDKCVQRLFDGAADECRQLRGSGKKHI